LSFLLNFTLTENFVKNAKFEAAKNSQFLVNLWAKLKLYAPIISSVENLHMSLEKLQLSASLLSLPTTMFLTKEMAQITLHHARMPGSTGCGKKVAP